MKYYKKGFTLVELLLIFFFLFLIMAALTPVITRKHKQIPLRKTHGFYACYRDDENNLRQTLIKGSKVIENDVVVDSCKFNKPAKALYYYVQVIGGGGGGADIESNPTVDTDLLIKSDYRGFSGYVACGDGTKSTYCDIDYDEVKEDDFNKLKSIKLNITASGSGGYNCEDDRYSACVGGIEPTGSYVCSKHNLDAKIEGAKCSLNSNDKYDCSVSVEASVPCSEGWTKSEIETNVTCLNDNVGDSSVYYYQIPYTYKLKIEGEETINRWGRIFYNGKYYDRAADGYGVSYTWNDNKMVVKGGQGALISLVRSSVFDNDKSRRCLVDSEYKAMFTPAKASCTLANGDRCLTEKPAEGEDTVDFDDLNISQYNYYQTQKLSYGYGGEAGSVKTMILRKIDDDVVMNPGRGGAIQKSGTASSFGKYVAAGGSGTKGYSYVNIDILPEEPSPIANSLGGNGRIGVTATFQNFINFVLSHKLKNVKEKLKNIGKGGNGTALTTACTYGYNYTPLILYKGNTEYDKIYVGDYDVEPSDLYYHKCNGQYRWKGYNSGGGYWDGAISVAEKASAGGSGAIIITW
jgi:hypothetical protein